MLFGMFVIIVWGNMGRADRQDANELLCAVICACQWRIGEGSFAVFPRMIGGGGGM
jgi:hypothetical protein